MWTRDNIGITPQSAVDSGDLALWAYSFGSQISSAWAMMDRLLDVLFEMCSFFWERRGALWSHLGLGYERVDVVYVVYVR